VYGCSFGNSSYFLLNGIDGIDGFISVGKDTILLGKITVGIFISGMLSIKDELTLLYVFVTNRYKQMMEISRTKIITALFKKFLSIKFPISK
jgi:hypothetical protein